MPAFIKTVAEIPEQDWAIAAKAADKSVEETQKIYSEYITANQADIENQPIVIESSQTVFKRDDINLHFNVNIWIFKAKIDITGYFDDINNFDLNVHTDVTLLGIDLGGRDIKLNPSHTQVCDNMSVGPAGVNLCFGIKDNAVYLRGTIRYIFGHKDFYVVLFHI